MLNNQGRPTAPKETGTGAHETFTRNRGLQMEEALLFEIGRTDVTGVDLDEPSAFVSRLGTLAREEEIGLPGLSEPETMRHYVRLSQKNYAIDAGLYPLGSCTMKHNPRINERVAALPDHDRPAAWSRVLALFARWGLFGDADRCRGVGGAACGHPLHVGACRRPLPGLGGAVCSCPGAAP